MRCAWVLAAGVAAVVGSVGCSNPPVGHLVDDGDGETAADGEPNPGDSDPGPPDPGDPEPEPDPLPPAPSAACQMGAGDFECGPGSCPVTQDVWLSCDDARFGGSGLRVLADGDNIHVSTSSYWRGWLFQLGALGDLTARELDDTMRGVPLFVAGSGPDDVQIVGHRQPHGPDHPSWITHLQGPADWESRTVRGVEHDAARVIDLRVAPNGRPHVWYRDGEETWWSTPSAGISFQQVPLGLPEPADSFVGGLDAAGEPLLAFFEVRDDGHRLTVYADGSTTAPGETTEDGSELRLEPGTPGSIIPWFALSRHGNGLRAAWPLGEKLVESWVPGSVPPVPTCDPSPPADACPDSCEETSVGLDVDAHDLALTEDGDLWIAQSIRHARETWQYSYSCDKDGPDCWCWGDIRTDESFAELQLVRIPADGSAPGIVFSMETPPLQHGDLPHALPPLSMDANGTDLAIALRLPKDEWESAIRILRIATTRL